jgi:UDP-glucose 4-epimerase
MYQSDDGISIFFLVFTSTRQVYGRPVYLPVDEEHRLSPPDINAIHKLAAENLLGLD